MFNFLQYELNQNLEECKTIPIDKYCPTTHKIFIHNIGEMKFIADNEVFMECYDILVNSLKFIISNKKETHAFKEPYIIYRPDLNQMGIEIGVMPIEQYNEMMGINDNSNEKDGE